MSSAYARGPKNNLQWNALNSKLYKSGFMEYLSRRGPDEITPEERALIDRAIEENRVSRLKPASALITETLHESFQVSAQGRG